MYTKQVLPALSMKCLLVAVDQYKSSVITQICWGSSRYKTAFIRPKTASERHDNLSLSHDHQWRLEWRPTRSHHVQCHWVGMLLVCVCVGGGVLDLSLLEGGPIFHTYCIWDKSHSIFLSSNGIGKTYSLIISFQTPTYI